MAEHAHALVPVVTNEQGPACHAIRPKVLFDDRGEVGVCDRGHPDDRKPETHPVLLTSAQAGRGHEDRSRPAAGAGHHADVAVATDEQRCGHGRAMLSLAEGFVRERGCGAADAFPAEEAVGTYARCGFKVQKWDPVGFFGGRARMRRAPICRDAELLAAGSVGGGRARARGKQ